MPPDLHLGRRPRKLSIFFEAARRKRNFIDYDYASVATRTEADEIVEEAEKFFGIRGAVDRGAPSEAGMTRSHPLGQTIVNVGKKNGELR